MKIVTFSKDETNLLRNLFWELKTAQNNFQTALDEVCVKHGFIAGKDKVNVSDDFKMARKIGQQSSSQGV